MFPLYLNIDVTEAKPYQYGFEIETLLTQFVSLIDNAMIMRYDKEDNERILVKTVKPKYRFAKKSRLLTMLVNNAKNFTLPCVSIDLKGISADKDRLAAKNTPIQRYFDDVNEAYKRPTPISLSISVSIVTKLLTDLYQIYGKFCSQFQPYKVISWKVPKNVGINHDEELRNKVEWDFNLTLEDKAQITEDTEDKYVGTMNFTIQGWIFPTHLSCDGPPILDIASSIIVTDELYSRMIDVPLVSQYDKPFLNPRELANGHIRILSAYIKSGNSSANFKLRAENDFGKTSISNGTKYLVFDGYNLSKAKAIFVPKHKYKGNLPKFELEYSSDPDLWPKIGTNDNKVPYIRGYELPIVSQSDNLLTVKLENINYKGKYDIILCDSIDYDSLNRVISSSMEAI